MSSASRLLHHSWILVLVVAAGSVIRGDLARVERIEYVSNLVDTETALDATSPTGHAGGIRTLLVPEHNPDAMQRIVQTQQMFAEGTWRVRHVDYDNAPTGRAVHTASAHRWWYGILAWCTNLFSDEPLAVSVERAALFVEPVLHLLLMVVATVYAARTFGTFVASLLAVALAGMFPAASAFLPGQPDDLGLSLGCALGSILPVLAPLLAPSATNPAARRRSFQVAGICGGLGLWINATLALPILGGLALGALFLEWRARHSPDREILPWRAWSLSGGVTAVILGLIDYLPAILVIEEGMIRVLLPLLALAWIGTGELLVRISPRPAQGRLSGKQINRIIVALAALPVLAVPVLLWVTPHLVGIASDPAAERLTRLPDGAVAVSLWAWFAQAGLSAPLVTTVLPLLLVVPAAWILARPHLPPAHRAALVLALGPVVLAVGLACTQLRGWSLVDVALLAVLAAGTTAGAALMPPVVNRSLWSGVLALALIPGFWLSQPGPGSVQDPLRMIDITAMIERDLAHWFALHAGPQKSIVLAPPALSAALVYYGNQRVIGTPFPENEAGFAAAVRLAGATTPDEAQAIAQRREVSHLVIPSWDPFMSEYARIASNKADESLVASLSRWQAPRWLRPVPYPMPAIAGFESQFAAIFAVVDVQDNATALSRLAEYFLEMGQAKPAAALGATLKHSFGGDLTALIARAHVAATTRDANELTHVMDEVQPYLKRGDDDLLPLDRRVSLALALATGRKLDLARTQLERCLEQLDDEVLRGLSTGTLYRMLALGKALDLEVPDAALRQRALELLPPEMRARL